MMVGLLRCLGHLLLLLMPLTSFVEIVLILKLIVRKVAPKSNSQIR